MECSSWSMTLIYSISWAIMSWFCTVLLSISALQVEFFLVIWPLISLRPPGLPRNSISMLLLLFSHSVMSDSATPWTEAHQTALPFTISQSLFKFMSIESVMPSNRLILCHPLLLLPSVFPSLRVFFSESALRIRWPKYWSFSFSISLSNEYSGLISCRMDCCDLLTVQGALKPHPESITLITSSKLKTLALRLVSFPNTTTLGIMRMELKSYTFSKLDLGLLVLGGVSFSERSCPRI